MTMHDYPHTCDFCGRELPDEEGNVLLGSWGSIKQRIYVTIPGIWPRRELAVALPRPLEFCCASDAEAWLAQAVDEKLCRDNDDRLEQAEADAAERARDANAELVDERCTWAYQTAVPA